MQRSLNGIISQTIKIWPISPKLLGLEMSKKPKTIKTVSRHGLMSGRKMKTIQFCIINCRGKMSVMILTC